MNEILIYYSSINQHYRHKSAFAAIIPAVVPFSVGFLSLLLFLFFVITVRLRWHIILFEEICIHRYCGGHIEYMVICPSTWQRTARIWCDRCTTSVCHFDLSKFIGVPASRVCAHFIVQFAKTRFFWSHTITSTLAHSRAHRSVWISFRSFSIIHKFMTQVKRKMSTNYVNVPIGIRYLQRLTGPELHPNRNLRWVPKKRMEMGQTQKKIEKQNISLSPTDSTAGRGYAEYICENSSFSIKWNEFMCYFK